MNPKYAQLKNVTVDALSAKLSEISDELDYYQAQPNKPAPVDEACKLIIIDMSKNNKYAQHHTQLQVILEKIEHILLKEARKSAFSLLNVVLKSTNAPREKKEVIPESSKSSQFNTSLLKRAQKFIQEQPQNNEQDENDWSDSVDQPVPRAQVRPPSVRAMPLPKKATPLAHQTTSQVNLINPNMNANLMKVLAQGLKNLGLNEEERHKKTIEDLLIQLLNSKNANYSDIIHQLDSALKEYTVYLRNVEDDANSVFSDDTDEEEASEASESFIFQKKAELLIQSLHKEATKENKLFGVIIQRFIQDKDNPLKIKLEITIPIGKVNIPSNIAGLFQNINKRTQSPVSPLSSVSDEPDTPERKAAIPLKSTPVELPQRLIRPIKKATTYVVSKNKASNQSKRSSPNNKTSEFLANLKEPKPKLSEQNFHLQFNELVQLKKQIKSLFDSENKITSLGKAEEARANIISYIYRFNGLKSESLTEGQKKNLASHASFLKQANLWLSELDDIIQQKETGKNQLTHERQKLVSEFKQAAFAVLQSDIHHLDGALRQYYVKKNALFNVLKQLNKEPKPQLIETHQKVKEHVALLKKQAMQAEISRAPVVRHQPEASNHLNNSTEVATQAPVATPMHREVIEHPGSEKILLDKESVQKIIRESEILSVKFNEKIINLKKQNKLIQHGTSDDQFMMVIHEASRLQDKLKSARQKFETHRDLEQYQEEIRDIFAHEWTQDIFASNRTNPWLKPITKLFEHFKKAMNQIIQSTSVTNLTGTLFKPFKVGTETSQKANEYEQGLENIITEHKKGS